MKILHTSDWHARILPYFEQLLETLGIGAEQAAYVGDDGARPQSGR